VNADKPELLPALRDRRSRRAFSSQAIPEPLQLLLWQSVSVAPSHGNTQPSRILVAKSPEVRVKLDASLSEGNKSWATAASLMVALAANPDHARAKNYGTERALWSFDTGIALGGMLAQATAMGLIAHPMTSFDEVVARQAFAASEDIRVLALIAIGFPGTLESLPLDLQGKESAPQERLPIANLVAVDTWTPENGLNARDVGRR